MAPNEVILLLLVLHDIRELGLVNGAHLTLQAENGRIPLQSQT